MERTAASPTAATCGRVPRRPATARSFGRAAFKSAGQRRSVHGDRVADASIAAVDDELPVPVLAGMLPGCRDRLLLGAEPALRLAVLVLERPPALVRHDVDPVRARVEPFDRLTRDLGARSRVLPGHDVVVDDRERLPRRPALDLAAGVAHPVLEQPRGAIGEARLGLL